MTASERRAAPDLDLAEVDTALDQARVVLARVRALGSACQCPCWRRRATRRPKCGRGAAGGRAPWAGARLASVVLTMPAGLVALCFDANDPSRLAGFWAVALGWETSDETADVVEL